MTGRDRTVLIVIVIVAILGASWMLVVKPERKQANELNAQVSSAQAELTSADGKLASARQAQTKYSSAYSSMVSLGKAVPPSQEVPSLMYQLEVASHAKDVSFASIVSGDGSTSSGPTAVTGFSQMPFTFVFEGGFFALERLFNQLTSLTTRTASGGLRVNGRLLTIQSVKLSPQSVQEGSKEPAKLTGTISATAYILPAGATSSATPSTGAAPATSTSSPSSPTAPAVVTANP